ncbi:MAG TPA: DUF3105 domain-containing protein [Vitreimonas sp.]|nr:DUF3105 domain-containing protein [Vitreimonas sp.]
MPGERPTSRGGASTTGQRVGRRTRPRTGYADKSFWQRYRGPLVTLAVIAAVALVGAFTIQAAGAKTWTCTTIWEPTPTSSPAPDAPPRLGYVQPDMGRNHRVAVPQEYLHCPPASGNHHNRSGQGPIEPRVYGPDDFAEPAGWIHNLEHGAIVILYRGEDGDPGLTDETQARLQALFQTFPPSPICQLPPGRIGPVIARFDDMATPFAALVWGRVLPLDTLDEEQIKRFWELEGERTNPEPQCAPPSPSPAAASPAPADSPGASPDATGSPAGSPEPTASPVASPASS